MRVRRQFGAALGRRNGAETTLQRATFSERPGPVVRRGDPVAECCGIDL
jgi:hypothetical protein